MLSWLRTSLKQKRIAQQKCKSRPTEAVIQVRPIYNLQAGSKDGVIPPKLFVRFDASWLA